MMRALAWKPALRDDQVGEFLGQVHVGHFQAQPPARVPIPGSPAAPDWTLPELPVAT